LGDRVFVDGWAIAFFLGGWAIAFFLGGWAIVLDILFLHYY
jgi:hypothetical protein